MPVLGWSFFLALMILAGWVMVTMSQRGASPFSIWVAIAVIGIVPSLLLVVARRLNTYRPLLERQVRLKDLKLVAIDNPDLFKVNLEVTMQKPFNRHSSPGGKGWNPGAHVQERRVRVRNKAGQEFESIARLRFRDFKLVDISWDPDLDSFSA